MPWLADDRERQTTYSCVLRLPLGPVYFDDLRVQQNSIQEQQQFTDKLTSRIFVKFSALSCANLIIYLTKSSCLVINLSSEFPFTYMRATRSFFLDDGYIRLRYTDRDKLRYCLASGKN